MEDSTPSSGSSSHTLRSPKTSSSSKSPQQSQSREAEWSYRHILKQGAEDTDKLKERRRIAVRHEPKKGLAPVKSCLKRSYTSPAQIQTTHAEVSKCGPHGMSASNPLVSSTDNRTGSYRLSSFELRRAIKKKIREANHAIAADQAAATTRTNLEEGALAASSWLFTSSRRKPVELQGKESRSKEEGCHT